MKNKTSKTGFNKVKFSFRCFADCDHREGCILHEDRAFSFKNGEQVPIDRFSPKWSANVVYEGTSSYIEVICEDFKSG